MTTTTQGDDIAEGCTLPFLVRDLGAMRYGEALALQRDVLDGVVTSRGSDAGAESGVGQVLLVEHVPPVITLSRRAAAGANLVGTQEMLARAGVELHETDRGGDITYHGPGQLVCYPIVDLNMLGLGLHGYMRLLEQAVIDTCADFGVRAARDASATGVWVVAGGDGEAGTVDGGGGVGKGDIGGDGEGRGMGGVGGKICAMGVRVRRWVAMHGLALNVTTDLSHFDLIVPCGLVGRSVTSLARELSPGGAPGMDAVKRALVRHLARHMQTAIRSRGGEPDRRR